jgi:hypothetical protein
MKYLKAKLKSGLTNVVAFLAISTIGLAIHVIGLLVGYSELAGLGLTVLSVGLASAVIFFCFRLLYLNGMKYQQNRIKNLKEKKSMTSQIQINNVAITIIDERIIINYPKHRHYKVIVNGKILEKKQ